MTEAPNGKIMARIMALLAQANGTDFEDEAATYLAKAQDLMVKHAIDEADLQPEQREKIETTVVPMGSSHADASLMWKAAGAASVVGIRYSGGGKVTMHLTGFATDLAFAQSLYASLVLQRESALRRAHRPAYENGRTFAKAFRVGFAHRVGARLEAAKVRTVEDSAPGTALVLADRASQAQLAADKIHGKTTSLRSTPARSRAGYVAGDAAGHRADVSGGRNTVGNGARHALAG